MSTKYHRNIILYSVCSWFVWPCKNKIKLFADELILIVNAADHGSVAEDIEELEAWESIWLLQINPSKCTGKRLGGYCP